MTTDTLGKSRCRKCDAAIHQAKHPLTLTIYWRHTEPQTNLDIPFHGAEPLLERTN